MHIKQSTAATQSLLSSWPPKSVFRLNISSSKEPTATPLYKTACTRGREHLHRQTWNTLVLSLPLPGENTWKYSWHPHNRCPVPVPSTAVHLDSTSHHQDTAETNIWHLKMNRTHLHNQTGMKMIWCCCRQARQCIIITLQTWRSRGIQ